ncbi:hypothetical protein [Thermophilibacter sp.]
MSSVNERAAEVMEHLCTHSAHGYSQPNRAGVGTGGGRGETITLGDGTTVAISIGDRDCSSAAIECYAALGVDCGGATYTGNMRRCMVGTGNFTWVTDLSQRQRGDILLNESHHTAVFLGGGKLGQFSISETGGVTGRRGDQTGYESNIKAYYNYPWDGMLRYVGDESSPHPVVQPPLQSTSGKVEVDGLWGSATTMLAEIVVGAPWKDGTVSRQNPDHRWRMPGCTTGWEWGVGDGSGSPLIKALQKVWGADPDGIMGPDTINKMIAYYMAKGSGATVCDGKLDLYSLTIKQFQRELNAGRI